jgi:hypothetical protein
MSGLFDFQPGEGRVIGIARSIVNAGQGVEEFNSAIEESGIKVRSEIASQVFDYFKNDVAAAQEYVGGLSSNARPLIANFPKSVTSQLRNFSYNVKVSGNFTGTSTETTRWVTVSTNSLLTPGEAAQVGISLVENARPDNKSSGGIDVSGASVTEIFQNSAGLIGEGAAADLEQRYGFGHGLF